MMLEEKSTQQRMSVPYVITHPYNNCRDISLKTPNQDIKHHFDHFKVIRINLLGTLTIHTKFTDNQPSGY